MPDRRTDPLTLEDLLVRVQEKIEQGEEQRSRLESQVGVLTTQVASLLSRVSELETPTEPTFDAGS